MYLVISLAIISLCISLFLVKSPVSLVRAKPGLVYFVGPHKQIVPELKFAKSPVFLIKPAILDNMRQILKYTHSLLEENNITYWVTIGTLLGAFRHKGFIPWDDDIDINIMLRDMDRLLKLKERIEKDGFILYRAGGGFKLAFNNFFSYPYVDLIVTEQDEDTLKLCFPLDKKGRPTFMKAQQWPQECLPAESVFPPKLVPFEDFEVYAPRDGERLVSHIFDTKALEEVRHRFYSHLVNHFTMMLFFRLGISKG